jgi:hypothetical protein
LKPKHVEPELGANSFSCPHCNAIAHQNWFKVGRRQFNSDQKPYVISDKVIKSIQSDTKIESADKKELSEFFRRMMSGMPLIDTNEKPEYYSRIYNLDVSECYSCEKMTLWLHDKVIYPESSNEIQIHEDTPEEILLDVNEAAFVLNTSPRSSSALLRLVIQKLCIHLGGDGKNLNSDIGVMVKNGLDARVQKALDVLRVIGNNAVHPGVIDFSDGRKTAVELFSIFNFIVATEITRRKIVEEMFDNLPQSAKEQIQKRDA